MWLIIGPVALDTQDDQTGCKQDKRFARLSKLRVKLKVSMPEMLLTTPYCTGK